jgi:broad specificity phosphatase PhoE
MENNNEKLIIVVRHGERADYAGQKPRLYKFDPELTEKGHKQAYITGELIKTFLESEFKLDFKNMNIALCSSPFARTLQTSRNLKNAFGINHLSLYVDNGLSEYIEDSFEGEIPFKFLTVYNNYDQISDEFEGTNLVYLNTKLPEFETPEQVNERVIKAVYDNIERFLKTENRDVLILVTHGTPVDLINQELKYVGPFGMTYIKYCSTYIYKFKKEKVDEITFVKHLLHDHH